MIIVADWLGLAEYYKTRGWTNELIVYYTSPLHIVACRRRPFMALFMSNINCIEANDCHLLVRCHWISSGRIVSIGRSNL